VPTDWPRFCRVLSFCHVDPAARTVFLPGNGPTGAVGEGCARCQCRVRHWGQVALGLRFRAHSECDLLFTEHSEGSEMGFPRVVKNNPPTLPSFPASSFAPQRKGLQRHTNPRFRQTANHGQRLWHAAGWTCFGSFCRLLMLLV
jgi:hypothetical protein